MGGLNDMKKNREAEALNQKRIATETGLNQMKKEKAPSLWEKIKSGAGKFWNFFGKPIKSLVGLIPGVGSTIQKGIEMGEKYIP